MTTDQDPPVEQGDPGLGAEPSEEELRAAYDAQIKKLRVEHLIIENVVTLANLGMRRTGLAPGTEDERDAEQVRYAIESIRALVPLVEQIAPEQVAPIREALSQLQLAFVRIGGQAPAPRAEAGATGPGATDPGATGHSAGAGTTDAPAPPTEPAPAAKPGEPGPAQRSGRLWVPGQ
jgi:hypothetical protein